MNRKKFIESHGATCENWQWSWSFVNKKKKFVIFGAWDTSTNGDTAHILSEDWEISKKSGRKKPGYSQSLEHIRLITDEGYALYTFPMTSSGNKGAGPKIGSFIEVISKKNLIKSGKSWYATDQGVAPRFPEEIEPGLKYEEGAVAQVLVNRYERSAEARDACIKHHGTSCAVCDFNFREVYGELGAGYIHIHHVIPLSKIRKKYKPDPHKDLVPVCANCHAMIHRNNEALTVAQLKSLILRARGA